ncbi:MAG: TetR/AcrR family transcriptional regulator [Burkholderiales bacterium]|nr:TetR/AcrR family transcriptional regulator [Burkholderiales bacterium]
MDISADPSVHTDNDAVKRHVLQAALRIAEAAGSWGAVHLHDVAREAQVSLEEVQRWFADKDAIAEGYFDLADAAMLALAREPGWAHTPTRDRLYRVIMSWLDALAPHKKLVGSMLGYKLRPEHLHLQARGVARISRTVQWFRETAMLPSTGWRREAEEAALTSIYLTVFSYWLWDSSPASENTRRFLRTSLAAAERGARWLGFAS